MTVVLYVPVLVAIVGLLLFLAARTNGDVKRIGEILLFCGLLAFVLLLANHAVRL